MQRKVEDETITSQPSWFALRSKPNFEFIVWSQLADRKIETYFPWIYVKPVNTRSRKQKPFFPGYMFVKGGLGDLYAKKIGLLRGVVGLVNFDGIPASLTDGMIEIVKRQVERENYRLTSSPEQLRPGNKIWINDPILEGIEARFERCINGDERVEVLLSLLGRMVQRINRQTIILRAILDKIRAGISPKMVYEILTTLMKDKTTQTGLGLTDMYSFYCLSRIIKNSDFMISPIPDDLFHPYTTETGAQVLIPHAEVVEFVQRSLGLIQ